MIRFLPFFLLILLGCGRDFANNKRKTGYDLSKPDRVVILPDILREVSALAFLDSNSFACVQDENGVLFIYDLEQNEIGEQHAFGGDGDYEGIAKVGNSIYILRSDGLLCEILDYRSKDFIVNSYETNIPCPNNEGLCYDADNNRLLIACKYSCTGGEELSDKRMIYGFDIENKVLMEKPVFVFDVHEIRQFAIKQKNNQSSKTSNEKLKGKMDSTFSFNPSAIEIHPLTKKLFLLSANDHLLCTFNRKGKIEYIERLDAEIYNKAEGITFLENYDLLISNEGQSGSPTLVRCNYKK